ncbi:MAG: bacillithiol biosynthesis cysteine-adding enzyme BshC [Flavobacteriaceae bacterium]|nr:bacillithiol biosynthesis cysteine-adding enzyme BshC [Bacteroidia bacterium]NNL60210.1 bacillithiol biosynthesis cysteine-adding enzyme BshC [Flavobacteriaceae bacterium]
MPTDCIPFRDTNYFSSLICDYLDEESRLSPFYGRFPKIENFKAQIEEKYTSFRNDSREVLVSVLKQQYSDINASTKTQLNIDALLSENTFTITTGHQLNLFTGPLYFLYKIISTINLTKELKEAYPKYNFVPIYWMATEDHDFEEINYFNYKGKKVRWDRPLAGAVGEMDLDGLDKVSKAFSEELGNSENAKELKALFNNAYLKNDNLSEATRYLANELFMEYGLVILDANAKELKQLFAPYIENELLKQTTFKAVSKTNEQLNDLSSNYKVQVNPREINLFYLREGSRERIVEKDGKFSVYGSDLSWSKDEIMKQLQETPERFSPNVILRPLYQEVVLPNLCYIGGGGELAYWFQLKAFFQDVNVPFPILLLRNSVLITTAKQKSKLKKLNLSINELFLDQEELISKKVKELSKVQMDFSPQKEHLKGQFEHLYALAEKTDKSFLGAVKAQERKQIKGLEHLEKRMLKAQKKKLIEITDRIKEIQEGLFPGKSLQERNLNFSQLYLEHGKEMVEKLVEVLDPLSGKFTILEL